MDAIHLIHGEEQQGLTILAVSGSAVEVIASSHKPMYDSRLLGTWRSDARRTAREIAARRDIAASKKAQLTQLFGKLVLRYTRTRCYATLDGRTEISRYVVVAKDQSSAAVVLMDPLTREQTITHVHFENRRYWISLGPFREYFRKVA